MFNRKHKEPTHRWFIAQIKKDLIPVDAENHIYEQVEVAFLICSHCDDENPHTKKVYVANGLKEAIR